MNCLTDFLPLLYQNIKESVMNLGDFRKQTANLPDDTPLLVSGPDHSYEDVKATSTTALLHKKDWSEDYGEDMSPEKEFGKRKPVIIIERK
jgi:hypothetical protein